MKSFARKSQLFIVLLIIFVPLVPRSQNKKADHARNNYKNNIQNSLPDSIRIDFPDEKVFVVFQVSDYVKDYAFVESFHFILPELIRYIRQSSAEKDFTLTPHQARVTLKGGDEKEIQISSVSNTITKLLIKEDQVIELLPPGWEIVIEGNDSKAYVYGKDLEHIERMMKFDFKDVGDEINSHQESPIGKKNINARMIVKNGAITQSEVMLRYPGSFLVFLPSAGLGVISTGKFYPEVGVGAAIISLGHSGRENRMIKISAEYRFNLSMMLSASYGWNMARSGTPRWVAPGIGIFNETDGEKYWGNKVRVFVSYDLKNNISLAPELFLSAHLSKSIFGLRLNYTLP